MSNKKGIIGEFKEFAVQGNAIDLAIGVVIGGAFGTIVKSIVDDVLMPIVGRVLGNADFSNFFVPLDGNTYETLAAAQAAGAPTVNYGLFINALIAFTIIAWVLFLIVKALNKLRKAEPEAEPTEKECPFCKTQIPVAATRCPNCTSEL